MKKKFLAVAVMAFMAFSSVAQEANNITVPVSKVEGKTGQWIDNLVYPKGTKYPYDMTYRIFVPANYDASNSYPMILCAHGNSGSRTDNGWFWADATRQASQSCFVVEPSCPNNTPEVTGSSQWILDVESHDGPVQLGDTPKNNTAEQVLDLLASIRATYNIDANRIYMQGMSMGGDFAWQLSQLYPNYFAAIVPMHSDMDNRPEVAKQLLGKPIWAFTSADDDGVFPKSTDDMIKVLKALGGAPRYTKYSSGGHSNTNETLEPELYNWVMAQRLNQREPANWTKTEETVITTSKDWTFESDTNYSGGTEKYSSTVNGYIEYVFTGTSVKLYGSRNTNRGKVDIYIDGVKDSTVDTYSPKGMLYEQEIFCKLGLTSGTHTIKAVVTGLKNSNATDAAVHVDCILYSNSAPVATPSNLAQLDNSKWTKIASVDPMVTKSGAWSQTAVQPAWNKYLSSYNMYSSTKNDYLEYAFTGTGVIVIGTKNSSFGKADIYLDGVLKKTVDTYYPYNASVQLFYRVDNLDNSSHTIRIKVKGTKNDLSSGYNVYVDTIMYRR